MMLHPSTSGSDGLAPADPSLARHSKRKATDAPESQERLSKRLSLLNIDGPAAKLYGPGESARTLPATAVPLPASLPIPSVNAPATAAVHNAPNVLSVTPQAAVLPDASIPPPAALPTAIRPSAISRLHSHKHGAATPDDDDMHVDNTKYKVYIYNIDDELSGDDESTASDNDATDGGAPGTDAAGKLVFLPHIEKQLRAAARDAALNGSASTAASSHRKLAIPRPILPNKDGELAGMQLVLYNDPSSLSVPRENDSVRQAIIDARARIRERQQEAKEEEEQEQQQQQQQQTNVDASMASTPAPVGNDDDSDAMDID